MQLNELFDLDEARRNPEVNQKQSALSELMKYKGRKNVFVTFTSDVGRSSHAQSDSYENNIAHMVSKNWQYFEDVKSLKDASIVRKTLLKLALGSYLTEVTPKQLWHTVQYLQKNPDASFASSSNVSGAKFGINPRSSFNTPMGIYSYPIDYVLSVAGNVPYQKNAPFIWVFENNGNILDLSKYTESDLKRDMSKLGEVLNWDEDRIHTMSSGKSQSPESRMWEVVRYMAWHIKGKQTVQWAKLFRKIGYNGVVDWGKGIIHPNEPTQAVFFSKDNLKPLEMIRNISPREDED